MNLNIISLSRLPLFANVSSEDLLRLERTAEERHIRARQLVFLVDQKYEFIYLLVSGRVKLLRGSSAGREVTFSIVNPLELFGECGLFGTTSCYACSAEALEESTVIAFRRSEFEAVINTSLEAMLQLFQLQARNRQTAENRLADFIFYDVTARLARLLVSLSATYGRSTKMGTLLKIKVTHQELANLIGSTRETTTLILSEFRRKGLIDFAGRKIIVLNTDALALVEGASYLHRSDRQ